MTLEQFLNELRELNYKWHVTKEGVVRCGGDCPLTALANRKVPTDTPWDLDSSTEAGTALGLSADDTEQIIFAADSIFQDSGYEDETFRNDLRKACGV